MFLSFTAVSLYQSGFTSAYGRRFFRSSRRCSGPVLPLLPPLQGGGVYFRIQAPVLPLLPQLQGGGVYFRMRQLILPLLPPLQGLTYFRMRFPVPDNCGSLLSAEYRGEPFQNRFCHSRLVHGIHMNMVDIVRHQVHDLLDGIGDSRLLESPGI